MALVNKFRCRSVLAVVVLIILIAVAVNCVLVGYEHTNVSIYEDIDGEETKKSKGSIFLDGLYFTTTTLSSVGYGDILPVTRTAKMAVACQQLFVFLLGIGLIEITCASN